MVAPDPKPEMEGRQRDRVPVYLPGWQPLTGVAGIAGITAFFF
jgi:hypothetical protein